MPALVYRRPPREVARYNHAVLWCCFTLPTENMNARTLVLSLFCLMLCAVCPGQEKPNIVLIYADDVGYGDLGCYGATRVNTPNIDKLAANGLRFTDAHSPSATCTPSRYAMLTGQYAFRQKGTGIARGDAAAIIRPGRTTMASLLKQAGYQTGVVGKWHLGLGDGNLNWNESIKPGPLEIGFDYCYLIPATGDRVPCVYVEDHHVVDRDLDDPIHVRFGKKLGEEPTGKLNPGLLKMHPSHGHDMTIVNGISRIGYMTGGKNARWVDEEMADRITEKAVAFIDRKKDHPFFLFFSLHDIHVPRVPHPRFAGKSKMGPRGDAIVQFDWCVGQIVEALQEHQLLENTLLIVTSDNGPVIDDGYEDRAVEDLGDHKAAGPFRGGKYSHFEGGTRVPMIVHWPKRIESGQSDALMSQVDFPATFVQLTNPDQLAKLTREEIPDSFPLLDPLLGKKDQGRVHLVEHAGRPSLRLGQWKFIPAGKGQKINRSTNIELGNDSAPQLYHLSNDIGEQTNLAIENPELLQQMQSMLKKIRDADYSRGLNLQ